MPNVQSDACRFCMAWFKSMAFEREERLEFCAVMTHREIDSTKGLSEDEWKKVADGLRGFVWLRQLSKDRQPLLPKLGEPDA